MGIVRVHKEERYSIIANDCFEDQRLSFKAIGLLCYLLSKPNNWQISLEHLARSHADGRDGVRAGIEELGRCGYITQRRQFGGVDYTVFERPQNQAANPRDHYSAGIAAKVAPEPRITALRVEDLNRLIQCYPPHRVGTDKESISQVWNAMVAGKGVPPVDALILDLDRRKESFDWTKEGCRYVPSLTKYIATRMWTHPITEAPASDRNAGGRGVLVQ